MARQGFLSKAGLGKETTWGSAVAVNEILPMSSEGLNRTVTKLLNEYLDRTAGAKISEPSTVSVTGDLSLEAVYDAGGTNITGIDAIIMGALGGAAYDATNGVNKYTVADDITTSFTIAINKDGAVWETQGAKVNTLEITGSAGGKVTLSAGIIAKELLRTGDSGIVNTPSAVNGLTGDKPSLIVFDHLAATFGQIGAATTANISEFTISISNNLSDPQFASGSSLTLEPVRNGFREVTASITFPRYEADTVFSWFNSNTELELTLTFTKGSNYLKIMLPRLIITEPPTAPVDGAGLITLTVPLRALYNDGDNTGMTFTDATAITGEIGIETKNARTATP